MCASAAEDARGRQAVRGRSVCDALLLQFPVPFASQRAARLARASHVDPASMSARWRADVWDAAQQGDAGALMGLLGSRQPAGLSTTFVASTVHWGLKVAIANDYAPCVDALTRALPRGASLFLQVSRHGCQTPLDLAASCGSLQTVNALLADDRPALSLVAPSSTLRFAAQDGHADVVQALLDAKAAVRLDTLPAATAGGDARTVRILLGAKASANARSSGWRSGLTPLFAAVMHGCTADVVDQLVRAKADPNDSRSTVTREGDDTPLHLAAMHCRAPAVRVLLEAKANVNALNRVSYTPLHCAAMIADPAVCNWLVAFKADVHASARGSTPLHTAVSLANAPCVVALVKAGADLEAINGWGHTPLQAVQSDTSCRYAARLHVIQALVAAKASVHASKALPLARRTYQ